MFGTWKILLAISTTIVLWASAFVGIRIGLTSYTPGALALLRFLVASLSIAVLYFKLAKRHTIQRKELPAIIVIGVAGIGIYNACLNYGEITVPAGIASFIIGLMPVITIILAVIFLKEQVRKFLWFGVLVSLIGLGLIAVGEAEQATVDVGVLVIFIATVSGSLYAILQKPLLKKYHPVEITAFAMWVGTVSLLIFAPQLWREIGHASALATGAAIYMGIFPAAIAYLTWSYVLSQVPASRAATYLYTLPIVATLMGWLILGEIPALLAIVGGLIALSGSLLVNIAYKRR